MRRQAAGGVRWTTVSVVATTVLQFVQLAILGRLLGPQAFGLMAIVTIVVGFSRLFGELGLSQAIIQRRNPTWEQLSSLYWSNVAVSALTFLVVLGASPLIAAGFGEPQLADLLPVAAVSFLLFAFGMQFNALAQKRLHFRLIAAAAVSESVTTLVVAVASAWLFDQGVWSLVWGLLAGTLVRTVILVAYGWRASTRPGLHFRWSDLEGYLSFGLYRTGAMSMNFFNLRVAQLVVGALFGAQVLGFYSIASNLALRPIMKLNPLLSKVAFPVFSRVQDDVERLKRGYLESVRILMTVGAPLMFGLSATAPTAVPLLLGDQWMRSVPLVQVLAFYALLRAHGGANGSLLMALGKANWSFYWNMVVLAIIPPVVYLASLSGEVVYVPWALLASQALLAQANYRLLVRRLIGPCYLSYLKAIGVPILLSALMGVAAFGAGEAASGLSEAPRFGVQVCAGALSYVALMWLFQRKELYGMIKLAVVRG